MDKCKQNIDHTYENPNTDCSQEELLDKTHKLEELNNALKESETRSNRVQELAHVGNWELDINSGCMWASRESFKLYGIKYTSSYISLKEVQNIVHEDDRPKMDQALKLLIEENQKYDVEFRIKRFDDGVERIMHSVAVIDSDSDGKPAKVLGVIQDITELRTSEEIIMHLAYFDALTDLPNRVLFIDRLTIAISHAKRMAKKIAVIVLDIDNFKKINDTLGYIVSDELIINISSRLKQHLRENETLARLSGDEFVLFIEDIYHIEEVNLFINRIKGVFNSSFNIKNHILHISFCYGIALFPDDNDNTYELLNNAETAVYKAKKIGKNSIQFFNRNIKEEILYKLSIERCLREAISKDELFLHYQPQVDTKTGELRGYEALLRFNSKELGMLSPLEFIPIAEETGLIVSIGEWVLRTACEDNVNWHKEFGFKKIVSVNISAVQLTQNNFVDTVNNILADTGLKPEFLELEITESVLIKSFDLAIDILQKLTEMGIKIALDDFGTGYSSINYLRKLPFSTLKIDKVFVQDIRSGSKEELITETIIDFAHKLGFEVVAEGIETRDQLKFLVESKCDHLQGYLLSRPIDKENLTRVISKGENDILKTL